MLALTNKISETFSAVLHAAESTSLNLFYEERLKWFIKTFAPCRIKIPGNRPCETLLLVGIHLLDAGMIVEMMVVAHECQLITPTRKRNSLPRANVRKYGIALRANTKIKTPLDIL